MSDARTLQIVAARADVRGFIFVLCKRKLIPLAQFLALLTHRLELDEYVCTTPHTRWSCGSKANLQSATNTENLSAGGLPVAPS